jgi:hypothetical protein
MGAAAISTHHRHEGTGRGMGTSFRVELQELQVVHQNLQALLHDHFQDPVSPLATTTYKDNTASDIMQSGVASGVKRAEQANSAGQSNFGPADLGLDAASALNQAHGRVQEAILTLLNEVNAKITDLQTRMKQTLDVYTNTDTNLHSDIIQVHKNA